VTSHKFYRSLQCPENKNRFKYKHIESFFSQLIILYQDFLKFIICADLINDWMVIQSLIKYSINASTWIALEIFSYGYLIKVTFRNNCLRNEHLILLNGIGVVVMIDFHIVFRNHGYIKGKYTNTRIRVYTYNMS